MATKEGGLYICSNQFNRVERIGRLYQDSCKPAKDGQCQKDRNRQFIVLGSDEFVDAIFDPEEIKTVTTTTSTTSSSATSSGPVYAPKEDVLALYKKLKEKKEKLTTTKANLNNHMTNVAALDGRTTDAFTALKEKYNEAGAKLTEAENTLNAFTAACNGTSGTPTHNAQLDTDNPDPRLTPEKYKEYYEKAHGKPPAATAALPTLAADRWAASRNAAKEWENRVPPFFPDLYKGKAGRAPVPIKLADFVAMAAPSALQLLRRRSSTRAATSTR